MEGRKRGNKAVGEQLASVPVGRRSITFVRLLLANRRTANRRTSNFCWLLTKEWVISYSSVPRPPPFFFSSPHWAPRHLPFLLSLDLSRRAAGKGERPAVGALPPPDLKPVHRASGRLEQPHTTTSRRPPRQWWLQVGFDGGYRKTTLRRTEPLHHRTPLRAPAPPDAATTTPIKHRLLGLHQPPRHHPTPHNSPQVCPFSLCVQEDHVAADRGRAAQISPKQQCWYGSRLERRQLDSERRQLL
jgi:hypothetical protein